MTKNAPDISVTEDELQGALTRLSGTSDLLPPREDDKVAGRISNGFARGLAARYADGSYQAERSQFVTVPKSGLSTRPAAVIALKDRVVLEALVHRLRPKITPRLLDASVVLWPRADETEPKYSELDASPIEKGGGYVVFGDVAGFYESVLHGRLKVDLAEAGAAQHNIDKLIDLLTALMGEPRGLPQGVVSSDSLATLYLAKVDSTLHGAGITFWRHGDDYRIWTPTWPDAIRAAHLFESALRSAGLLANSRKLRAQRFSTYAEQHVDLAKTTDRFKATIEAARLEALETMTEDQLMDLASEVEIDEDMQWQYFYHGTLDRAELASAIAPALAPKSLEVIEEMFREVVSPDLGSLHAELRHARLAFCLRRLAAAKSTIPLPHVAELILHNPDETQLVANYLLAVVSTQSAAVSAACQYILTNAIYMTDWQRAWVLRVLSRCGNTVSGELLENLVRNVDADSIGWLPRVEMARVLAVNARLSKPTVDNIYAKCGEAFRSDLVGVVVSHEEELPWARQFLEGAASDPLAKVVITALRENMARKNVAAK